MQTCELIATLAQTPEFREFSRYGIQSQPTETHHIWGGTQRRNRKANLIRIGPTAHRFIHAFPNHGRLACLIAKMRAGKLDLAALDTCSNQFTVGWLERQEFDTHPWMRWKAEVLQWARQAETKASRASANLPRS